MIHFEILKCNDILKFNEIDKKMKKTNNIYNQFHCEIT